VKGIALQSNVTRQSGMEWVGRMASTAPYQCLGLRSSAIVMRSTWQTLKVRRRRN